MVTLLAAGAQSFAANIVIPDVRIHQDDYTALMAVDARLAPGLKPFQSGGHGKFQVVGWNQASQRQSGPFVRKRPVNMRLQYCFAHAAGECCELS